METVVDAKRCRTCGDFRSLDSFYRDARKPDGRRHHCKDCERVKKAPYREAHREKKREYNRAYHAANRDRIIAQQREYRTRPEVVERKREYMSGWVDANRHHVNEQARIRYHRNIEKERARSRAKWAKHGARWLETMRARRAADPERFRAQWRERYRRNPERQRAAQKKWNAANIERLRAYWRVATNARRAQIATAPINDLTTDQWEAIEAAAGGRCTYCGKKRKLTMDHVIPISRGGSHTASNVVPACQPCNSRKNAGPIVPYQVRFEWTAVAA